MKALITSLALLFANVDGHAVVNRCIGSDGGTVFTDRSCESLGITTKLPSPVTRGFISRELGFGCAARTPEAMRAAVHSAIQKRDLNALAGLYNFDGRSSRSAAPVVRRLERLTHRAALEINLIYPESETLLGIVMTDPDAMPSLRIVQHAVGNDGPLRIENFGLARAAGCLWLSW